MSAPVETTAAMTTATPPSTEAGARVAVSVINMKGGVGKTTIATMLGRQLARSYNVLAIDLDPQANMSQALMGEAGYDSANHGGPQNEQALAEEGYLL